MSRIIVSTYLPSMYIPDQPFSLPTAPIRGLSIENGQRTSRSLNGVEAITSPNYVTGLAAALLSKVSYRPSPFRQPLHRRYCIIPDIISQSVLRPTLKREVRLTTQLIHPSSPKTPSSLILLPLPISSISDTALLNALTQISYSKSSPKTDIKLTRGSWNEDDDEPFSQVGMGGIKKVDLSLKREVDGMYM